MIRDRQKWCGCIGEVVQPREAKVQQSGTWSEEPESTVKERGSQRNVRRMFKMLREVWMNIGLEKLNMHKGITIKALLDSGATRMFMDKKMAARHGFKLQKLEKSIANRNVDGTNNSGGVITYQVKANVYYKGHVERMRIDVCDLGKIEIILGMPWLAVHNPEINWEIKEVKMMKCPPLYSGVRMREEERKKRGKKVATLEEEKIVR